MSRPRKTERERRSWVGKFTTTAEEGLSIQMNAAAAGMSVAEFLRRRALSLTVTPPAARADARLLYELSALGNNTNQLSRHMNAGREFTQDWEELTEAIYETIDRIWTLYGLQEGNR